MLKKYKYAWYLSGLLIMFIIYINVDMQKEETMKGYTSQHYTDMQIGDRKESEKDMEKDSDKTVRIRLSFAEGEIIALLYDNETTKQFLTLLPLNGTIEDYVGKEKIMELPKSIADEKTKEGYDPEIGDIACYSPWGNLVLFYDNQPYAQGLLQMGKIESGIDQISLLKNDTEILIERI